MNDMQRRTATGRRVAGKDGRTARLADRRHESRRKRVRSQRTESRRDAPPRGVVSFSDCGPRAAYAAAGIVCGRVQILTCLPRRKAAGQCPKRAASEKWRIFSRREKTARKTPACLAARQGWRGRSSLVWRESQNRARTGTTLCSPGGAPLASFPASVAVLQQSPAPEPTSMVNFR